MKRLIAAVALLIILAASLGNALAAPAHSAATPPFSGWLAFDSTASYATALDQPELNAISPDSDFTVELWIKDPYFFIGISPIFGRELGLALATSFLPTADDPPTYNYYVDFTSAAGTLHSAARGDVGINALWLGYLVHTCTSSPCPPAGWFHLAYVYDHAAGKGTIYWNGQYLATTDAFDASTLPFILGGGAAIDELRVSDIQRYSEPFTPPAAPFGCDEHTPALWHFDEVEGSTVFHDACGAADNLFSGYRGAHTEGVVLPPAGVTINGPAKGAVGRTYTFTTTLSPLTATPPITYTWAPMPDSGQGSATAIYTWGLTGTQTITLTAENAGGLVSDTHTIAISEWDFVYLPLIRR